MDLRLAYRNAATPDTEITRLRVQLHNERTERERLERVLALRSCALDAASTHFMITDLRRRGWPIVYVNRAIAADHGYEPEELLGRSATILAPMELNEAALASINDALLRGAPHRTELHSRRKDGSTFWTGLSLEPIRDASGYVTHYVSIGADITARLEEACEKRRLQDELRMAQKLEAVGQLAAGIAHEINTPVQYVGDSIHFLQSAVTDLERVLEAYRTELRSLPANGSVAAACARLQEIEARVDIPYLTVETPKAFERSHDGIARMSAIVRAMKEFAHPDAPEQAPADINHAIETTMTVASNEYKYTATIETQFATLPKVTCNIGELNQVFLNLIVNASHAIQEAGKDAATGRITVRTAADGGFVRISISDNGCGIPPDNLERIFDPFFTTKEVGKGTGQGLPIARAIVVDKHGGRIDVNSRVGEGTTFDITLPIAGRTRPPSP